MDVDKALKIWSGGNSFRSDKDTKAEHILTLLCNVAHLLSLNVLFLLVLGFLLPFNSYCASCFITFSCYRDTLAFTRRYTR